MHTHTFIYIYIYYVYMYIYKYIYTYTHTYIYIYTYNTILLGLPNLPLFLLVNMFSPWPFSPISAWDCHSWAWVCDDGSVVRQQVPVQQPPWYCSECSVTARGKFTRYSSRNVRWKSPFMGFPCVFEEFWGQYIIMVYLWWWHLATLQTWSARYVFCIDSYGSNWA